MAEYLGFTPKDTGEIYFVSYKKEDHERVGEIARCLDEMGVPMWYDEGIHMGAAWEKTISVKIHECKALIFFATKEAFSHDKAYLKTEYDRADEIGKPIYVIWLEDVLPSDPVVSQGTWYTRVRHDHQGLEVNDQTWDKHEIALEMIEKFDLIYSTGKLLDTAFRLLKDGKYNIASRYCDMTLAQEPENATAYLGKLMAEKQASRVEDLANCAEPLESSENYAKVLSLGSEKISTWLRRTNTRIVQRIQKERQAEIYDDALAIMNRANLEGEYRTAAELFQNVIDYSDAKKLSEECLKMAEVARRASLASKNIEMGDSTENKNEGDGRERQKRETNFSRQRKKRQLFF